MNVTWLALRRSAISFLKKFEGSASGVSSLVISECVTVTCARFGSWTVTKLSLKVGHNKHKQSKFRKWGFRTMPISVPGHADHPFRADGDHDSGMMPITRSGLIPIS
jgi:hypothetical protein